MESRSIWKSRHGSPWQTLPHAAVFAITPRVLLIENGIKQGDDCNLRFNTATVAQLAARCSRGGQ